MTPDGFPPPGDCQEDWYYVDAGDVQGPVKWWSLLNLLVAGEIPNDSLVWRPEMEDWARAHLLSDVSSYLPPAIPRSPRSVEDGTTEPRPKVPEPSAQGDGPPSHPNPLTEESGRGVVVMFLIAIVVVGGLLINIPDDRSSQSSAATRGSSEMSDVFLDGALTEFPEKKQRIVYDYLEQVQRVLSKDLRTALLDTLETFESGRRAGMEWSRQGRRRLSDVELSQLLTLESKILQAADKRICGQIVRGIAAQSDVWRATMTLDTVELKRLMDLRMRAFRAELRSEPSRRLMPSDDAVASAMTALLDAMPQATEDSLLRVVDAESIPLDQECWGTRTMYRNVGRLGQPQESIMTRYLLWLGTGPGAS